MQTGRAGMFALTWSLVVVFLAAVWPGSGYGISPYDPAVDWSEHIFGPSNMNAFLGCGGLSAGISSAGEITVLRYPSPSFCDQMGYLTLMRTLPRMGALPNMGSFFGASWVGKDGTHVAWLRDPSWTRTQQYADEASDILITTYSNEDLGLSIETWDLVAPDEEILVRHVTAARTARHKPVPGHLELILFENFDPCTEKTPFLPIRDWLLDPLNDFELLYSARHGALIHFKPDDQGASWEELLPLLHSSQTQIDSFIEDMGRYYPKGVFLAVGADRRPGSFQCGRQDRLLPEDPWPQDAYYDALDGMFSRSAVAPGRASGALTWPLDLENGEDQLTVYMTAASTASGALALLESAVARGYEEFEGASERWWEEKLRGANVPATTDAELARVCKRALVSLVSACDRATGSLVASIAAQPPYNLDWPRDGAFMNRALDTAGFTEIVTRRNLRLAPLFRLDTGLIDMCFYSDGMPGGPLPFEIDNLSLAIWGLWDHVAFLEDRAEREQYLSTVFSSIRAGADFLVRCRDPRTGLQCPTMEADHPWLTQGLAGAASARMGLEAAWWAGEAAGEDPDRVAAWRARSRELGEAIVARFWNSELQQFDDGPLACYLFWPYPLLQLDDVRMRSQAASLLKWSLDNLHKRTTGGGYEPLVLWMPAEQAERLGESTRGDIVEALTVFSHEVHTKGTYHFGEAYVTADLDGDGTLEFEAHAAQPQVPIGAMVYLTATALYGSRGDRPEIRGGEAGTAGVSGCGACGARGTRAGCTPTEGIVCACMLMLFLRGVRAMMFRKRSLNQAGSTAGSEGGTDADTQGEVQLSVQAGWGQMS